MAKASKTIEHDEEQGGALISNADLQKQIEQQQKMLAKISTASKFISFKGGQIIIDGKPVPGAKTEVIVLAFMAERSYFPSDFDPDARQSPLCYAYSDGDEEFAPHPEVNEKQCDTCQDCEFNKWGSASKGKGKACRESVRVALLPAQSDLAKAQVWHARIPITSVSAFKGFVSDILGYGKPIYSVVAKLSVIPDAKTFFKIQWDTAHEVPKDQAGAVIAKAVMAQAAIAFPYPKFDEEEEKAAPARKLKTKKR